MNVQYFRYCSHTVACHRDSSIGCKYTGEADNDNNCEVETFESKRLRVDLQRQGLCNVTLNRASDRVDEAENEH